MESYHEPNFINSELMEFIAQISKDHNVKITKCELDQHLKDISLSTKQDDYFYAKNDHYRMNLRGGGSFYKINKTAIIARKGLPKIIDLKYRFLDEQAKPGRSMRKNYDKLMKSAIFAEVELKFEQNQKVKISVLEKANGENCQISYLSQIDRWVIASKNVSLLAKDKADLVEKYKKNSFETCENTNFEKNNEENFEELKPKKFLEKKIMMPKIFEKKSKEEKNYEKNPPYLKYRFYFAYLIGVTFFDILESRQISIQNLKADMKDITLVGEYCGNPDHVHLIPYKNTEIKFFAIVDHNSLNPCIFPDLAYLFFKKHNLPTVAMKDLGEFEKFNGFQERVKTLYGSVSQSPIEEEAEGVVLYFSSKDNVLSLCKIKTLEYLIFRGLREQLKQLQTKDNFKDSKRREKFNKLKCENSHDEYFSFSKMEIWLKEFEYDLEYLCKDFKPPKKREYYLEVAKKCFSEFLSAQNFPNLHEKYLHFLTNMRNTINSEEYNWEGDWKKIEEEKKSEENNKKKNLALEKNLIENQPDFKNIQNQFERKPEDSSSEIKNKKTMKYLKRDFNPTYKI